MSLGLAIALLGFFGVGLLTLSVIGLACTERWLHDYETDQHGDRWSPGSRVAYCPQCLSPVAACSCFGGQ